MSPAHAPPVIVRFGKFEADLRAGDLRCNGVKVHLQDLPFRMLELLLSHPDEVVTHEQLRQALWPDDVFVDFDRAIRSAVKRLRDALGDSPDNPIFIETVERRGYRWIAPLRDVEPIPEIKALPVGLPPPRRLQWRRPLAIALPILVVLLAAWILRPAYRARRVNANSPVSLSSTTIPPAANPEARDFYLKGRFFWNKRTPESLNQAVDAFTQAIVHDPNYAPAYMGLADSYNLLREYSAMPANEAYARAFTAAQKAVELDPLSSEAHASLAFVTFYGIWDVASAEREFRRAIDLDPNNAKAHHWFATFLQTMSRHEESLTEIERARELDPGSASILADKGRLLWAAGHHDEGLKLLKQVEAADPTFASPHRYLRYAYFELSDYPDYLEELKQEGIYTHRPATMATVEAASRGYKERGGRGLLDAQLRVQEDLFARGELSAYWVAETAACLGNRQQVFHYLDICAQAHDEAFLLIGEDPNFTPYRGDPAFERLLARTGQPSTR